ESDMYGVTVEVVAASSEVAARTTTELRDLALEHNVFRAEVVSCARTMFDDRESVLRLHARTRLDPEQLILPQATFDDVRRQVGGVARKRQRPPRPPHEP